MPSERIRRANLRSVVDVKTSCHGRSCGFTGSFVPATGPQEGGIFRPELNRFRQAGMICSLLQRNVVPSTHIR